MSDLRFDNRVAIVTGAGNGLGRSHALLLASRGCKVVVNDLGGGATGSGKSSAAADQVVADIKAAGGEAVANYDSVEDGAKIVQQALDTWKRIDIVVNNAGILRDTSFQKMSPEDWDLIYRVHVLGSFRVTKAAWDHMRDAGYGRILFTASAAGIYGNFGQANYAMAKLGLVGFSNTLAIEGKKKNVLSNTIAPIAGSRLTETILPKDITDALKPEYVSPLVAWLCHESCEETGGLFEVGGGLFTKLRWERTEGKLFKLGRAISPEQVQKAWGAITDFGKATHPTDITNSMQPVLGNLQSKSQGGNEFIDVDQALGFEFPAQHSSYDEKDLALYALGIGAGSNPSDTGELQYVYENAGDGFKAIPTFGVVPALKLVFEMAKKGQVAPGLNYGFDRILHGEQYTEIARPLPPNAQLTHKAKVKNIYDKGRHAIVVTEIKSFDDAGNLLVTNEITTFVRGAGGWGGDRGPTAEINLPPNREPDATVTEKISESQALLYRLSGDINPLHVDPSFAKAFGFDRPILHGLCTFGYAARHVIKQFSNNDPRYFKSIKVRFTDSVFPGETLITEMWKESDNRIVFRCRVKEREKAVISNAAIELYSEIPKVAEKKAATAASASSASANANANSGEATSSEAFAVIRDYVETHPDIVGQVGKTYLFRLSGPDSAWMVDLKNGKGGVSSASAPSKADCTLDISDSDFRDLVAGKADPQKLYFGGKMKIGGDVMASQKLMFLKKIDPARATEVVKKLRASGGAQAATTTTTSAAKAAKAPAIVKALAERIAKTPTLVKEVGAVVQIVVTSPDASFVVDLKNGAGSVKERIDSSPADVTLKMSDEDLEALAKGESLRDLYQRGRVRLDGDAHFAPKLDFWKGLV
ncbi:Oxidoreductase, short chain dehydrogenase/reductase family [Labilithrix luteola]|uniref:Oxidoreductase, short chain dehydrogenase/reductase family n=1 Tax=Labilithrix luteola TaxID=1391654 RepID=A0A0K1PU16_9BACT|nr:peroxisomal multifunctional enzyme type 2 [Labilithrix luteola]AKU96624.1 Oxidoreductase, short chain dehydrogenase/reductase family [Labilithrix luteola]